MPSSAIQVLAVPQAVGRETEADGQPAGERGGIGDETDAVTARRGEGLAAGAWWESGPGGDGVPGQWVASVTTSRAGWLGMASWRPSLAGRKMRRA
jgi:hypothetical protein